MFAINKKFLKHFDWINFFIIISISLLGLLFIYSATCKPIKPFSIFFKKQLFGIISGIILYIFFSMIDHRQLMRLGYFFYFLVIGLLMFTIVKGSIGMGAQRWINLGFIKVQPSELAKLFFPAFVAYFLKTQNDTFTFKFRDFIPILITLVISFLLILKQPDLGTALIFLFSGLMALWLAGISKRFFLVLFVLSAISTPILWKTLKPYQKNRLEVFFGSGKSKKERYQLEQSQISIGSGGFRGKGTFKGTQNKLLFLPESRTDFIFSVLCEEWGFAGALLIIFLYAILFLRMFFTIARLTSPYMQLFAFGIMIPILLSTLINICMVTGLLPIVGIPLPLMSYGLSNLWATFIALDWFNSIKIQAYWKIKKIWGKIRHKKRKARIGSRDAYTPLSCPNVNDFSFTASHYLSLPFNNILTQINSICQVFGKSFSKKIQRHLPERPFSLQKNLFFTIFCSLNTHFCYNFTPDCCYNLQIELPLAQMPQKGPQDTHNYQKPLQTESSWTKKGD